MGYHPRFEYQWGCRCRDVTLGACPQTWVKPSALIVYSEPTDCHVSLWPIENGGLPDQGVWCHWGREECDNPAGLLASQPAGLTLRPSRLERWLATLSGLSSQVRIPVGLSVPGRYIGGLSADLGKAQRIDSLLRADWLSCFFVACWEWRVARQGWLVSLRKGGMWQSSRPASFSASGPDPSAESARALARDSEWVIIPGSNTSGVVGAGTLQYHSNVAISKYFLVKYDYHICHIVFCQYVCFYSPVSHCCCLLCSSISFQQPFMCHVAYSSVIQSLFIMCHLSM